MVRLVQQRVDEYRRYPGAFNEKRLDKELDSGSAIARAAARIRIAEIEAAKPELIVEPL
jgi:hypothetical protein